MRGDVDAITVGVLVPFIAQLSTLVSGDIRSRLRKLSTVNSNNQQKPAVTINIASAYKNAIG